MKRLDGKRVVVIGAGSIGPGWGNGKATAVTFAREGAKVLCVDVNLAAAQETAGLIENESGVGKACAINVTDPDAGDHLMSAMSDTFGGIDVMHYNVGASHAGGTLETTDADWSRIVEMNLMGAVRLTRAVLPAMRTSGAGVLTYISSLAATMSGPYTYVSYEASKAALCRYARSVAKENARFGIRANTILPGPIETPHVEAYVDSKSDPEVLAQQRTAMVPLGRQGTAWDVANAALFLASDEAGFITGTDLRVDGGMGC